MKTIRQYQNLFICSTLLFFANSCIEPGYSRSSDDSFMKHTVVQTPPQANQGNNIKLALLLDTSSSMDGLIEQAKSQLWEIVNTLALAKKAGNYAELEIALYQYGNSGLLSRTGYIEKVLPLTNDLDEISNQLFNLTTNGGDEYCGAVISAATKELTWNEISSGLNLIFIAGNEGFDQGSTNYRTATNNAAENGIIVNTIFCGNEAEGKRTHWNDGANLAGGIYASLDMNTKTIYTTTPYDQQITDLNTQLNDTYLAYGTKGESRRSNQIAQDNNSKSYSSSNLVNRAVSKSSHLYNNSQWDLVDATNEKGFELNKIATTDLPEEMQGMNDLEKEEYLNAMTEKRTELKRKIADLAQLRSAYIEKQSGASENGLNNVLLTAIRKQATDKGFKFENNDNRMDEAAAEIALPPFQKAFVNFEFFEETMKAAKEHRSTRLVDFKTFTDYSKDTETIILDTRSKEMYDRMHIKGAVHLNFSDFNQASLAKIIPSKNTRVLIYCNNNFSLEPMFNVAFRSKSAPIKVPNQISQELGENTNSLALNIPTYINLYGYGYENVFELSEMIYTTHPLLELEGTDIK